MFIIRGKQVLLSVHKKWIITVKGMKMDNFYIKNKVNIFHHIRVQTVINYYKLPNKLQFMNFSQ